MLHDIETLEHDGLQRRFRYYESTVEGERPLVLVLHGGGATLESFVVETKIGASPFAAAWLELADAAGSHVAFPEGWESHWNCCRADCDHCGDADDTGFLFALFDALDARLAVDPARVHLAGESNGGFMVQRMAEEHGDRFGAQRKCNRTSRVAASRARLERGRHPPSSLPWLPPAGTVLDLPASGSAGARPSFCRGGAPRAVRYAPTTTACRGFRGRARPLAGCERSSPASTGCRPPTSGSGPAP